MNGTYCLQLAGWLTCKCWYVIRGVSFALFPTFTVGVIKASVFPLISMSFVLDTFWSFCSYWSWLPRSTSRPLCPRSTNRSLFPRGPGDPTRPFPVFCICCPEKETRWCQNFAPDTFSLRKCPSTIFFCFKENLKPWERGSVMPLTNYANLPNELHTGSWATF